MTLIPAFYNEKQIKYHGLSGQVSEEEWREYRDENFESVLQDWSRVIHTWKDSQYKVGLYLPFESLMDPLYGPELLTKYAKLLQEADYQTTSEIECTWYTTLGEENIVNYQLHGGYEFGDYVPGFREEQKERMVRELEDLMEMYGRDDEDLVNILMVYLRDLEGVPVEGGWM